LKRSVLLSFSQLTLFVNILQGVEGELKKEGVTRLRTKLVEALMDGKVSPQRFV